MISDLNLDNYNYSLGNNRIAKYPKSKRDNSKLLVYKKGKLINQKFYNIDKNIPSDSSVFFNNSKVINARLIFKNKNNAKIEILVINLFNKNYQNLLFNKNKVIVEKMIKNIINIYNSNNITVVETTSIRFLESIYLVEQMINEKYKNLNIEKFLYNN